MPATFTHSGGSITFTRTPQRPDRSLDVIQPARTSAGGSRFGFAHTIINQAIRLRLRLTTAEKNALLAFFNSTVKGMSEVFIYTDPMGNAQSVRFGTPRLNGLREKAYDSWEITVALRIFGGDWLWPSGDTLLWSNGDTMGV
jgi:hypothetical protein